MSNDVPSKGLPSPPRLGARPFAGNVARSADEGRAEIPTTVIIPPFAAPHQRRADEAKATEPVASSENANAHTEGVADLSSFTITEPRDNASMAAQHESGEIAAILEGVARRIRKGEIVVSFGAGRRTDEAVLAAVLASLLGERA